MPLHYMSSIVVPNDVLNTIDWLRRAFSGLVQNRVMALDVSLLGRKYVILRTLVALALRTLKFKTNTSLLNSLTRCSMVLGFFGLIGASEVLTLTWSPLSLPHVPRPSLFCCLTSCLGYTYRIIVMTKRWQIRESLLFKGNIWTHMLGGVELTSIGDMGVKTTQQSKDFSMAPI